MSTFLCKDCSQLIALPSWITRFRIRCEDEGHEITFNLEVHQEDEDPHAVDQSRFLGHLAHVEYQRRHDVQHTQQRLSDMDEKIARHLKECGL